MLSFIDFGNAFTLIPLNTLDIESEEDSDTDKSKEFNANIKTYLTFEKKYKEFTIINVNLNITKNNGEEYPYNKDDLYLESNNIGYYKII